MPPCPLLLILTAPPFPVISCAQETMANNYGNVLKGWDGYLQARARNPTPTMQKKQKTQIKDADRLFSMSSYTYKENVHGATGPSQDV